MDEKEEKAAEREPNEPRYDLNTLARVMDRRDFFQWAAGLSIGATAFLGLTTAALAVNPPGRSIDGKTKMGPTPIVAVSALQPGKPQIFEYGDDSVFITKMPGGAILALNAACPHVKCKLSWDDKAQQYSCPCHASFFKIDGARISGPAPRGMDKALFAVKGGQVVVSGFEQPA